MVAWKKYEAHGGTGLEPCTNGRQARQCFVNGQDTCQEGFVACRRNARFKLTGKHASWITMAINASACERVTACVEFCAAVYNDTIDHFWEECGNEDPDPMRICDYPNTYFSKEWGMTNVLTAHCCDCARQPMWQPEIALSLLGLPVFLYLVHLYIHAGSHSERDVDHANEIKESREIINSIGLGVEEEDMGVYDALDFEFLRTSHILTFLKMFFVSKIYWVGIDAWNVFKSEMKMTEPSSCSVGNFEQGLTRLTACSIDHSKSTGQAKTFLHSWFVVFLLFFVYNILVDIFLPFLRQCFAIIMPFVPRHDRGLKKVVYRFSLRACCRSPSPRSRSVRKIVHSLNHTCRKIKKIVALTYVTLYPFALDELLDGLYCHKKPWVSVLDNKTPCADVRYLSIIYITIWTVPALVMIFIVAKAAYSNMETDAHFLQNWGFLVIGLKPTYMGWQLLEFLEISLLLPKIACFCFF